jgi:hypothetical protein
VSGSAVIARAFRWACLYTRLQIISAQPECQVPRGNRVAAGIGWREMLTHVA